MRYFLNSLLLVMVTALTAFATTTLPQEMVYEGQLLSVTGTPVASGTYDYRFSFWSAENVAVTDITAGTIDAAAATYKGWTETHTQPIRLHGHFSHILGETNPIPVAIFDFPPLWLQVEVKSSGAPDGSYELMDHDPQATGTQRMVVVSVPYTLDSDKLDHRDTGFGAGNIPYLDPLGQLPASAIPNYTNENTFTLDANNDAPANITLAFGADAGATIAWDRLLSQFTIGGSVFIGGDLTLSGTVNGVTIGPRVRHNVLSVRYPESAFHADGTANKGMMHEEQESVLGQTHNVLRWETREAAPQDYDLTLRYQLSEDFISWEAVALELFHMADAGARVDFTLTDDLGGPDLLAGAGQGLTASSWTKSSFPLPQMTAGQVYLLNLKYTTTSGANARTGDILLHYTEA